jgi:hypothetical protein
MAQAQWAMGNGQWAMGSGQWGRPEAVGSGELRGVEGAWRGRGGGGEGGARTAVWGWVEAADAGVTG